jgi:DnaJ-domain-containing protein 1
VSWLVGQFARQAQPTDPLVRALLQWGGELENAAMQRWRGVMMSGIRCVLPERRGGLILPCDEPAIAACAACQQPTCLHHAMVAGNADVVCLKCINEAVNIMRQRPRVEVPRPQAQPNAKSAEEVWDRDRKAHLRTLGLKDPADWAEIEAAYKELLVKHHPDRAIPSRRKQAEDRFKRVRVAYDWLTANKDKKVA